MNGSKRPILYLKYWVHNNEGNFYGILYCQYILALYVRACQEFGQKLGRVFLVILWFRVNPILLISTRAPARFHGNGASVIRQRTSAQRRFPFSTSAATASLASCYCVHERLGACGGIKYYIVQQIVSFVSVKVLMFDLYLMVMYWHWLVSSSCVTSDDQSMLKHALIMY